MSTPSYPSIGYSIGHVFEPVSQSARMRVASNGRAHVQHIGVYDDVTVSLLHPLIQEDDVQSLIYFWDHNKSSQFIFVDHKDRGWYAQFAGQPTVEHVVNHYWNVTVTLILHRMDQ
jgi:hypothetical protein